MATLVIEGRRVKVDDSFLSLPKEQQDATVDEIAASLGQQPGLPSGAQLQGKVADLPSRQPAPTPPPDLLSSTMATVNGLSASVPFLQNTTDAIGGTIAQLTGGNYGDYVARQKAIRDQFAQQAPLARTAGEIAGSVAGMGALGTTKLGQEALGITGKLGQRVANSALSSAGYSTLDALSRGETGSDALASGAVGGLVGGAVPLVGAGLKKAGQGIADAVTSATQRKLTSKAILNAPNAADLKSAASDMFEAATGGQPVMLTDTAYFKFLGGVKRIADKYRINPNNDKQSVGLLETLMQIADDTLGNTRVDMKDLHLVRQLAQKVGQSSEGRDAAFGKQVVAQMDDFIRSLRPDDILGGADPTQAANQLLTGISTWARANKVAAVEEAIRAGQVAASGPEKGIRNALRALVKDEETWKKFSKAEQLAILDVVNGTPGSNILKLLGTFGFGGNTATNGIGGAAGMALGQMAGGPIGMVAGPVIGSIAKNASEKMTAGLADKALGAVATPNIPIAKQMPNLIGDKTRIPLELLIRGGAATAN